MAKPPRAKLPRAKPPSSADADSDRRRIRIIIALVIVGWLLALGLMAVAATFWDTQ